MTIGNLYQPDVALKVENSIYLVENPLPQILIWIFKERATAIVLNKQT